MSTPAFLVAAQSVAAARFWVSGPSSCPHSLFNESPRYTDMWQDVAAQFVTVASRRSNVQRVRFETRSVARCLVSACLCVCVSEGYARHGRRQGLWGWLAHLPSLARLPVAALRSFAPGAAPVR
eukprot:CAMPEP_0176262252 /NCGR_PEP_ID=MMETSP0121_2-20121125/40515_1 /TAXON_ID=160619 /ORGANISM="Kryptoperidinium foliaceum, Strain CCMP 1326" /LENGTH=123 /DNA_ID=CAMNT_0017602213 /DNA_START=127 /DNA_END=496 /DNA_ORIENTATION=+